MKYLSDFHELGFEETEIVQFLSNHGIKIGDATTTPSRQEIESIPDWKGVLSLLPTLTVAEVASAFIGLDLEAPGWFSDDEQAELSRWQSVIQRAIRSGQLEAEASDFAHDGTATDFSITPASLAAWCSAKNLTYPLNGRVALPGTDAGLREALTNCERERAQWKSKAESLEEVRDQRKALQSEIGQVRDELRIRTEEVASLATERNSLKSEALAGKARLTALKIIGGLAMKGYAMDIHAERLNGIVDMVKDMEGVGAGVTEKTLRDWLKEAANVIEPQKAKR